MTVKYHRHLAPHFLCLLLNYKYLLLGDIILMGKAQVAQCLESTKLYRPLGYLF
jgi:hypothetical protein